MWWLKTASHSIETHCHVCLCNCASFCRAAVPTDGSSPLFTMRRVRHRHRARWQDSRVSALAVEALGPAGVSPAPRTAIPAAPTLSSASALVRRSEVWRYSAQRWGSTSTVSATRDLMLEPRPGTYITSPRLLLIRISCSRAVQLETPTLNAMLRARTHAVAPVLLRLTSSRCDQAAPVEINPLLPKGAQRRPATLHNSYNCMF